MLHAPGWNGGPRALTAALLLLTLPRLSVRGEAQTSGTSAIVATATVTNLRSVALTASGVHDLEFGTVTPGVIQAPPAATDGARFNVVGEPNAPVTVTFILPATLTNASSQVALINFNGSDGIQWTTFPTSNVRFDPRASYLTTLDATGLLVVGLLGSVRAPETAVAGMFAGTITLTVSY